MFTDIYSKTAANIYEGLKTSNRSVSRSNSYSTEKCLQYILEHFTEDLDLDRLAAASGISKFNLCRVFQRRYGITPIKWLWLFRVHVAAEFIKTAPSWNLTDVAFACGFTSSAHFSRSFVAHYKVPPSFYRTHARITSSPENLKRRLTALQSFDVLFAAQGELVQSAYLEMRQSVIVAGNSAKTTPL